MTSLPVNDRFRKTQWLVAMMVACATARSAPAAKFIDLGLLPGPGPIVGSSARGLSPNGSIVVGSVFNGATLPTTNWQAFRWTNSGGLVGLGNLAAGIPGGDTTGLSVSSDGSVVVGVSAGGAFRWTAAGGMVGLGAGTARDVSSDGSVVVGNSGGTAFRWTAGGGLASLGDLAGGAVSSSANSVSADGTVVAGMGTSASGTEAFRWTAAGGMVGLGDLPGGSFFSDARRIATDGSIVGFSSSAAGPEAFRWTSGSGMVGLGVVGVPFRRGISADGTVVVGDFGGIMPMIWDPTHGTRDLQSVLAPLVGTALDGWELTFAYAISADGLWVAGEGNSPFSPNQAWLAYLPEQTKWSAEMSGTWDFATNWEGSFVPGTTDDVVIDPVAALTVTGPNSNRIVKSLTLGGSGAGRATLALSSITGELQATSSATINADGELLLADGRIFTAPTLSNSGVLRGSGTVNANLTNLASGEVRVASGQSLLVNGTSQSNAGKLEVIGGSVEVIGSMTNATSTGLVTGRSATLRFSGGLDNNGSLLLSSGDNDVSGDITNNASGKVMVAGGAHATFYDDVAQNGTLQVIKVGSTTSVAVFAGAFTGSGGSSGGGDIFFLGDLRPGNSPAIVTFANSVGLGANASLEIELGGTAKGRGYDSVAVAGTAALDGGLSVSLIDGFVPSIGNTFEILTATGGITGSFATESLPVPIGLTWDVVYGASSILLTVISAPAAPGDYNQNGVVDAADYIVWRKTLGQTGAGLAADGDGNQKIDSGDYQVWRIHFGQTGGSGAGIAVPEASASILLFLAVAGVSLWRRSAARTVSTSSCVTHPRKRPN